MFTPDYSSHGAPRDTGSIYVFIFATVQEASTNSYIKEQELGLSPPKEYSKHR